jgi:hypothetical protein
MLRICKISKKGGIILGSLNEKLEQLAEKVTKNLPEEFVATGQRR